MLRGENRKRFSSLGLISRSRGERRRAWTVALVSIAFFVLAAPFARIKLPEVWAFIPSYQSALLVNDLVTAVLLFAQVIILRSPRCCCWRRATSSPP